MGVKVVFKTGKSRSFKTATGYKYNNQEYFKGKKGSKGYKAAGYVIFFPNKKTIHYKKSTISNISKY